MKELTKEELLFLLNVIEIVFEDYLPQTKEEYLPKIREVFKDYQSKKEVKI